MKIPTPVALVVVLLVLTVAGWLGYQHIQSEFLNPGASTPAEVFPPYFTEEEWTVRQVSQYVADLGALAAGHKPEEIAIKKKSSSGAAASYSVKNGKYSQVLSLPSGVWNPATYAAWAKDFFPAPTSTAVAENPALLKALLKADWTGFLAQNRAISQALQIDPASASGYLDAALLLGAIGLNDYAGLFRDTRPALNRMVAYLAVADALGIRADEPLRQLAEAIRLTLCGQQADALALLDQCTGETWQSADFQSWATILRLRNTNDWRDKASVVEAGPDALKQEYFRALASVVDASVAGYFQEGFLKEPSLAYCRIANEVPLSVSLGRYYTPPFLVQEVAQAGLATKEFVPLLNQDKLLALQDYLDTPAGSPVLVDEEGKPIIQVAGRNFFAQYHQRHLMQALQQNYALLKDRWGVPKQAKDLEASIKSLPDFLYKPFLLRMIARTPAARESANQACIALIRARTEIVTPCLWASLRLDEDGRDVSATTLDFHSWFHPEVPSGTAFDMGDRLFSIGVGDENDVAWIQELRKRAPYDYSLARHLLTIQNGGSMKNASPESILEITSPMAEYESRPMRLVASAYKKQPELYETWMKKLALLDSDAYLELAEYFVEQGNKEKAAEYFLQAFEKTTDRVYMANLSRWIVVYLYEKGDIPMATKIAADAAEVYSYKGLCTYLWLMEAQGKWNEALETARKIDERYNNGRPAEELVCLIHQRAASPQLADSARYKEVLAQTFPDGMQKVEASAFVAPPTRGVLVNGNSASLRRFGISNQSIIVALDGYRTDTFGQYAVVRALTSNPHMRLIVWNGKEYQEKEGDLDGRLFGVDMKTFSRE